MPELKILSDVFSPHYVKTIRYEGDHPSRTLNFMPGIMRSIFRVTSTNFYEDEIKWDRSFPDNVEFYGQWRGKYTHDARTAFWIKVKVIGKQSVKDKKGYVTIYIHPYLATTFPYSNFLDKALYFSYTRLFYKAQRRKYIEKQLYLSNRFEQELRKELGIR
jgi:hypothetical protein